MDQLYHPPAMVAEVLEYLQVRRGGVYLDSTVGMGGHAEAILEASAPDGVLLGVDMDASALQAAGKRLERFGPRVRLVHGRFSQLETLVAQLGVGQVDGVLADLGPSRPQLLSPARGFSFDSEARLDARYDRQQELTAWHVVNRFSRADLVRVLSLTGKPHAARRIANAIVARRATGAIDTPRELAQLIRNTLGRAKTGGSADVATEWFMAIRMFVNRELEEATEGIEAAAKILSPRGRLVVLSWDGTTHATVRRKMRELEKGCSCPPELPCVCGRTPVLKLLTPRGRQATAEERRINPATRTCRLFAAEKVPPP
ncbi:MAG: 16S rRNA (cytosine(1402)-N(4))-methyltransferase RsmH [Armatimonadetes bacterium]|nr:16S rRNA (cytosine(1402)-N(4))-methyltransferase RsmH [Armatimonadota bacterium]